MMEMIRSELKPLQEINRLEKPRDSFLSNLVYFAAISKSSEEKIKLYKQIEEIVEDGADVNCLMYWYSTVATPLDLAVGNEELITLLQRLGANRSYEVTDLLQKHGQLFEELDVRYSPSFTEFHLSLILANCPKLKKINLSECECITRKAFQAFIEDERCPEILLSMNDFERFGYLHCLTQSEEQLFKKLATSTVVSQSYIENLSKLSDFDVNKKRVLRLSEFTQSSQSIRHSQYSEKYLHKKKEKSIRKKKKHTLFEKMLKENQYIDAFIIDGSGVDEEDQGFVDAFNHLMKALCEYKTIKRLIVKNFRLSSKVRHDFFRLLRKNTSIDYVEVSGVSVSTRNFGHFLEEMEKLVTEKKVDANEEAIEIVDGGDDDLKKISRCLQINIVLAKTAVGKSRVCRYSNSKEVYVISDGAHAKSVEKIQNNVLNDLKTMIDLRVSVYPKDDSLEPVSMMPFSPQLESNDLFEKYTLNSEVIKKLDKEYRSHSDKDFLESVIVEQLVVGSVVTLGYYLRIYFPKLIDRYYKDLYQYNNQINGVFKKVYDHYIAELNKVAPSYNVLEFVISILKWLELETWDEEILKNDYAAIKPSYFKALGDLEKYRMLMLNRNLRTFYLGLQEKLKIRLYACGLSMFDSDEKGKEEEEDNNNNRDDSSGSGIEIPDRLKFLERKGAFVNFITAGDDEIKPEFRDYSRLALRAEKIFELVARSLAYEKNLQYSIIKQTNQQVHFFAEEVADELVELIVTGRVKSFNSIEQTSITLAAAKLLGVVKVAKEYEALSDINEKFAFLAKHIVTVENRVERILKNSEEINQTTKENRKGIRQALGNQVEIFRKEEEILKVTTEIKKEIENQKTLLEGMEVGISSLHDSIMEELEKTQDLQQEHFEAIQEMLDEQNKAFEEYQAVFNAFADEELKLSHEMKRHFDGIIKSLGDSKQQAKHFFKGKTKTAAFCREMYIYASEKLKKYTAIAQGGDVPEDSVHSAAGLIANNADLIPVPAVPFVLKGIVQIGLAIYNANKIKGSEAIDHLPMNEVLVDLIKSVAKSYTLTIERLADYASIQVMAQTAFQLIKKHMLNKKEKVLEKLNSIKKHPEMINLLVAGLLNEKYKLHMFGGATIKFEEGDELSLLDKGKNFIVEQLANGVDSIPVDTLEKKMTTVAEGVNKEINLKGMSRLLGKLKTSISRGVKTKILLLPTAEDAFQNPKWICTREDYTDDNQPWIVRGKDREEMSKALTKNEELYSPCFTKPQVVEFLHLLCVPLKGRPNIGAELISRYRELAHVFEKGAAVVRQDDQAPEDYYKEKSDFLEALQCADSIVIYGDRVLLSFSKESYPKQRNVFSFNGEKVKLKSEKRDLRRLTLEISDDDFIERAKGLKSKIAVRVVSSREQHKQMLFAVGGTRFRSMSEVYQYARGSEFKNLKK